MKIYIQYFRGKLQMQRIANLWLTSRKVVVDVGTKISVWFSANQNESAPKRGLHTLLRSISFSPYLVMRQS